MPPEAVKKRISENAFQFNSCNIILFKYVSTETSSWNRNEMEQCKDPFQFCICRLPALDQSTCYFRR